MIYLVHAANTLYLLSYLVRDILWLRVLTVVAGSMLLPFYYFQPTPLWAAIAWNLVFTAINVHQIRRLLLERRPVQLTEDEQQLYRLAFRSLTTREFVRLVRLGRWCEARPSECLVEQGQALDRLMVIHAGRAAVRVDGAQVATLETGRFVGEMSFLTGEPTSASVWSLEPLRYVTWPKSVLEPFLRSNPELRAALQMVIGTDLVAKLRARPLAAA